MRAFRRPLKLLLALALSLLTLAVIGAAVAFVTLRRSLPEYDRDATIPSLTAPVIVERDALDIPTIRAATWDDAARALGYVHAQDRLFQMDLARRYPAGRLAELVGAPLVSIDMQQRRYQLERVAAQVYAHLPERQRTLLTAYAHGVNAAIEAMPARPPEYLILRAHPEPWRPVDCVLVNFNMHLGLSLFGNNEHEIETLRDRLPPELVAFLTPRTTQFDAPLIESDPPPAPPPIPGPDVVDLRDAARRQPAGSGTPPDTSEDQSDAGVRSRHLLADSPNTDRLVPGSNSFAVSGKHTADGRAILENDMHLGFSAPNIWYRADIRWAQRGSLGLAEASRGGGEASGGATGAATGGATGGGGGGGGRVVGVTLPGVPSVIVGSNTHVAWGFTNATGDFADFIIVEPVPGDPSRYRTPEGSEPFTTITETITVRAGDPETLTLQGTRWGPVFSTDSKGHPLVLQWIGTDPDRNNLAILDMPLAEALDEAIAITRAWHGPPQNVLLASADGRIAWVLAGDFPLRRGLDGTVPMPRTDPGVGWFGSLPESQHPVIIDPPSGILYTANNRTLALDRADLIGRNWAPPFRARRIRDLLETQHTHTEQSLLGIALDTRLEAYDFYRDLVLETIPADEPDPLLAGARSAAAGWDGHADPTSTGLILLIRFRNTLDDEIIGAILRAHRLATIDNICLNDDEPLRRLLQSRPANLLPPAQPTWDAMIRHCLDIAARELASDASTTQLSAPWSTKNRARIKHPLTLALGSAVPILDMPPDPLPGHPWCVRVAAPTFGASERLVVSPGHEDEAILHMPTGQCGHPLSPHYRDMQHAYLHGDPTPLLPGPPKHTLTLRPHSPSP